jgi:hypothetical protein
MTPRLCSECDKPLGRKGWGWVNVAGGGQRPIHYACQDRLRVISAPPKSG